jgi:hypothetical protein
MKATWKNRASQKKLAVARIGTTQNAQAKVCYDSNTVVFKTPNGGMDKGNK